MIVTNNASALKRQLMLEVAKATLAGTLLENVEHIPVRVRPRGEESTRCCIWRDRAIIRYRLIAILGGRIEDETDEVKPLSDYAKEALARIVLEKPILTVLDESCTACIEANYFVTNACKGCLARPCTVHCPTNAISIEGDTAKIVPSACINCGKCQQVCPYHAIIFVPVPCQEACPVDAIDKDSRGKIVIDFDRCIMCGKCVRACPFTAVMDRSQMVDVLTRLGRVEMNALLAPAVAGQFDSEIEQISAAARKMGFDRIIEVASGADAVAEHESGEFRERMSAAEPFMTTSCCYAYTETVRKHIPELKRFVAKTGTPLAMTAARARREHPSALNVFIGPCIAKKQEGMDNDDVDYVLTFEEFATMLEAYGIDLKDLAGEKADLEGGALGRGFPVTGGLYKAISHRCSDLLTGQTARIETLDAKSLKLLKALPRMKNPPCKLMEVMCCYRGCIGGPAVVAEEPVADKRISKLVERSPVK